MNAMMIPGNGNASVSEIWFPYVKARLEELGLKVIAKNMPDPEIARMRYWLPFIEGQIGKEVNVILIGHSSGAVAIMRYLESHAVKGAVLVGACHTDLGIENERLSGYYDTPWRWKTMKGNSEWIIQFASINDPWIPIEEARFIHDKLGTEYHERNDMGHFMDSAFPDMVEAVRRRL